MPWCGQQKADPGVGFVGKGPLSEFGGTGCTGEGDNVTDVAHTGHVDHQTLETEAETGVRDCAEAAQIAIPPVIFLVQTHFGHALIEYLEALFTLGTADDLADPVTAFHAFAAAPRGTTSPSRKGPQMTTTPETLIETPAPVAAAPAVPPVDAAVPANPSTMTADAIRAEAAEVAQVCAQAARLGVTIDAADAVTKGLKPEALRARVLADLAARSDAAGIIATAPAAAAKESPIVAAAKKTATDAKR